MNAPTVFALLAMVAYMAAFVNATLMSDAGSLRRGKRLLVGGLVLSALAFALDRL